MSGGERNYLQLHSSDNVAVASCALEDGCECDLPGRNVRIDESIPPGHKFATADIPRGQPVIKYGETIGSATRDIVPGDWVHTHNLAMEERDQESAPCSDVPPPPESLTNRTFNGYRRGSGKVGTRNYVAVISTVNCSASVSQQVARRFDCNALADYPNVDGVVAFTHHGGCAMPFVGEGHAMLNRVLGGFARHPNIGAYLLVGLGCEMGAMGYLVDDQRLVQIAGTETANANGRPPTLLVQDCGGTTATIAAACDKLHELLPLANDARRESAPASELILATECGGSDGYSGITANPAVGVAADLLVACGGTVVLGETPEIFGAEHLLTRRAASPEIAEKLLERIRWWQWYTGLFDAQLDNNPSVGNKEGGITTIAEKSLGAVAKGGNTSLVDVYQYAEPVTASGLVVMDTPGYDPASVTGMVAGGANMVVFTTGRGSCFGCKPTPSIKVATNTPMFERMADDMDINAGPIIHGRTIDDVGHEIFDKVLSVASGEPTKSEALGYGDEEFIPWTVGPML